MNREIEERDQDDEMLSGTFPDNTVFIANADWNEDIHPMNNDNFSTDNIEPDCDEELTTSFSKKLLRFTISAIPTILILSTIIFCSYGRFNESGFYKELNHTLPASIMSPLLHTTELHLTNNVIWYAILSTPVICFLPCYIQPATFIACSAMGLVAHNLASPRRRLVGASATVYGLFIVFGYAVYDFLVKSDPKDKRLWKTVLAVWSLFVLIMCSLPVVIHDPVFDNPQQKNPTSHACHLGGVIGAKMMVVTFHALKNHFLWLRRRQDKDQAGEGEEENLIKCDSTPHFISDCHEGPDNSDQLV